jgi:ribonucleotide monophosphatase NagD (HAD superfamily)
VLDRLGVAAAGAAVVGDRLSTDMAMARSAGMAGVLVLTGATSPSDLATAEASALPDYVIETLPQLLAGVPIRPEPATARERRNLERA